MKRTRDDVIRTFRTVHQVPEPGDLIQVEKSRWYALGDGERLRVCEPTGWMLMGEEIFVAPRANVSTFWGPNHGPPDGEKPEFMSTSGGPFRTWTKEQMRAAKLEHANSRVRPGFLEFDPALAAGKMVVQPEREDLPFECDPQKIVEFYSQQI